MTSKSIHPPGVRPVQPLVTRRRWEYITTQSDTPFWATAFMPFGDDGWELVTVYVDARIGRDPMFYAVFKREAQ